MNTLGYSDNENLELSTKLLAAETEVTMVKMDLKKAKEENERLNGLVKSAQERVNLLENELRIIRSSRGYDEVLEEEQFLNEL